MDHTPLVDPTCGEEESALCQRKKTNGKGQIKRGTKEKMDRNSISRINQLNLVSFVIYIRKYFTRTKMCAVIGFLSPSPNLSLNCRCHLLKQKFTDFPRFAWVYTTELLTSKWKDTFSMTYETKTLINHGQGGQRSESIISEYI